MKIFHSIWSQKSLEKLMKSKIISARAWQIILFIKGKESETFCLKSVLDGGHIFFHWGIRNKKIGKSQEDSNMGRLKIY